MILSGKPLDILWVTRSFSERPASGDVSYSNSLLRALTELGARIVVFARVASEPLPVDTGTGPRWITAEDDLRGRLGSLASSLPSDPYKMSTSGAARVLREALQRQRFDCIVIDAGAMGWVLDALAGIDLPPIVYVSHNHERTTRAQVAGSSAGFAKRLLLGLDAAKYGWMEQRVVRRASFITAITPDDAARFMQEAPGKPVVTLLPGYVGERRLGQDISEDTPRSVVLYGSLTWVAKQENLRRFVTEQAARLHGEGIGITVIGHAAPEFVSEIEGLSPSVRFLGRVEDPVSALRAAGRIGLVAEGLGGGFKLKTLDYVFSGLPVAGLKDGLAGFPELAENAIARVENLTELGDIVVRLMDDTARLNAMRQSAFAQCERLFGALPDCAPLLARMGEMLE